MATHIEFSTECKKICGEISITKQYRYAIFAIRGDREIFVEKVGERDADYDSFLQDVHGAGTNQCRYGLYDYAYHHQCQGTSTTSLKEKLFLLLWCPKQAKIRDKMIYSSSFSALKRELPLVQRYIQATDLDEATRDCVEGELRKLDYF